jgi:3',5'-cyclic AMP phosphodiesterase CpdA
MRKLPQVRIIHISDLHFGAKHICIPADPAHASSGIPLLENLLEKDLTDAEWADSQWASSKEDRPSTPLVIAVTGDLTQQGAPEEYDRAYQFLEHLSTATLLGVTCGKENIFLVSGKHDVAFREKRQETRFQNYCAFYNKLFERVGGREPILSHNAAKFTQIHVQKKARLVIAEVNSCLYVEKETEDESRGQVDHNAIAKLRGELGAIQKETEDFIKIALVHHHPVLIPSLVEPRRGYDAIVNSGSLLRLLREQGFQLILHGHKHHPQIFSFDPESAWSAEQSIPHLIVAGGSCGSRDLPTGVRSTNTYNVITVKWDPKTLHARFQAITRGLLRVGDDGALDPDQWKWKTLRVFDRSMGPFKSVPAPGFGKRLGIPKEDDTDQKRRWKQYESLRFNMPVAEVMPSLMPGQAYEVRVWLEPHRLNHQDYPVEVTWSAGTRFERKVCESSAEPNFCAFFHYWGPTLVQAKLKFKDGKKAYGYVYARFPEPK